MMGGVISDGGFERSFSVLPVQDKLSIVNNKNIILIFNTRTSRLKEITLDYLEQEKMVEL